MKLKKKGVFTREEMAQYLAKLAGMVADGEIVIEDINEPLGNELSYSLELKKKRSSLEIELSIKARGIEGGSLVIVPRTKHTIAKGRGRRPYRAKQIKKIMGALWKDFRRMALSGPGSLDPSVIKGLQELMDEYDQYADDVWAREWATCKKEVLSAIEASRMGDVEALGRHIAQVDSAIRHCHKLYK